MLAGSDVPPVAPGKVRTAPARRGARALDRLLTGYLAGQEGTWAMAVIDLTTGALAGVNEDMVFRTASTMKLPLAMDVLAQASRGQASLEDTIAYVKEDWEDGTGVLQGTEPGTTFSIGHLVELAITGRSTTWASSMPPGART